MTGWAIFRYPPVALRLPSTEVAPMVFRYRRDMSNYEFLFGSVR